MFRKTALAKPKRCGFQGPTIRCKFLKSKAMTLKVVRALPPLSIWEVDCPSVNCLLPVSNGFPPATIKITGLHLKTDETTWKTLSQEAWGFYSLNLK